MRDVETEFHSTKPAGKIGLTYVLCPENTGADFEQLLVKYFPGARVFHDPYLLMEGLLQDRPDERAGGMESVACSVVIHLQALFASEMRLVGSIRDACPGVAIYLAGTDGRPQWLAAGLQQGATGLLTTGGVMDLQLHKHGRNGLSAIAQPPSAHGNGSHSHGQNVLNNGSHQGSAGSASLSVNLHVNNKSAADKPNGVSAAHTTAHALTEATGPSEENNSGAAYQSKNQAAKIQTSTIVEEMDDPDVPLQSPGEPVLTAEELRALLSADPV